MCSQADSGVVHMAYEVIQVECYSGHRANEHPVAFTFRERPREVLEIVDRWYEGNIDASRPEISYFKVRTIEGQIFLLRYLSLFDSWSIRI
jgi:hypothetical protein